MAQSDFSAQENQKEQSRSVSLLLGLGIFLLPLIFSWLTLRRGYSTISRMISFSWLCIAFLVLAVSGGEKAIAGAGSSSPPVVDSRGGIVSGSDSLVSPNNNEIRSENTNNELEVEEETKKELVIQRMNDEAKKIGVLIHLAINPLDSNQIWIFRRTELAPNEVRNWEYYFLSLGTSVSELKDQGFSTVRIYTSQSRDVNKDYALYRLRGNPAP